LSALSPAERHRPSRGRHGDGRHQRLPGL